MLTLIKLRLIPSLLPYFWQIIFWQCVHHVDLPPSQWIFDKNHPLLAFKITSCTLHSYIYVQYCIHYTKGSEKRYIILKFHTFRHNFSLYRHNFWEKDHSKMCFGPPPSPLFVKQAQETFEMRLTIVTLIIELGKQWRLWDYRRHLDLWIDWNHLRSWFFWINLDH